jgi:hypothetical protein
MGNTFFKSSLFIVVHFYFNKENNFQKNIFTKFALQKTNKTMKKLAIISIIIIGSFSANAQKNESKVKFNVGAELGFATGNLNVAYSIGIGATAQLEYAMDEKSHITLNSGIIQYVGRKLPSIVPGVAATKIRNSAVIPILAGVKYNFATNFYGAAELGASVFSGASSLGTKFTYIPGLGFKINEKLDALVKYTGYSDAGGAFGVRIAYSL